MERDAVVVPGVSVGSSLACVRSLGRYGITPVVAVNGDPAPARGSRYCEETIRVPSPKTDLSGYADALLGLARRPAIQTIVPLREADVHVLAERRPAFGEHVGTPWPPSDTLERVQDRLELLDLAARLGVPTPATERVDEWDRWDETTVVKPRYTLVVDGDGAISPNVEYHPSTAASPPSIEDLRDRMKHLPLAQACVPGADEFGFFALYDSGTPVVTFQHQRIRSGSYAGGASVYRKSVERSRLAELGTRLLSALDWHGPAMVEFKRDPRDGTYRLMEINPRFWGSLALPIVAGVDFPRLYYELATGRDLTEFDGEYEVGVGCHVLTGEVSHLLSVLRDEYEHIERPSPWRTAVSVCRSVASEPHFDYLSREDPKPFVLKVRSYLG